MEEQMKHGLRWSTVTIALAVIVVVALVTPALGGPSLKSLVKKEVAKQVPLAPLAPLAPPAPRAPPAPPVPMGGSAPQASYPRARTSPV
jgi:hypothetical protein